MTGNTNFQFAAPLLALDGRGIDLNLALSYNSRIWHKAFNYNTSQNEITLNIDQDWPAPGWTLGFGKLINMGNDERTGSGGGFMLVEPDGTRHPYRGTSSVPIYQQNWTSYPCINCDPNQVLRLDYNGFTTDGTLINYNVTWQRRNPYYGCQSGPGNCVASYSDQPAPYATAQLPNGTIITYGAAPWYLHNAAREYYDGLYPTQITDASGNYITISYVNGQGPKINLITDTLGRVVQFHYDAAGLLTAISAPDYNSGGSGARRVIARFQWTDVAVNPASGNYGFSSGLVVRNTSAIVNSTLKSLKAIYYPATQTGYWFGDADSYSSYGMLMKVLEMRGLSSTLGGITDSLTTQPTISGGAMSLSMIYNYPTGALGLGSEPSFTQMSEDWAANDTGSPAVTTYNVTETSTERTVEVTRPDGLMSRQVTNNDVTSDLYGMIKFDETRDGATLLQKSEVIWDTPANWKTNANYWSPRPQRTVVTDERGQVTATDYFYGARHNQVTETRDYDYGGTTLLRRTVTQYLNDLTTNYDAPHIFRLVAAVDIRDAAGNRVSRTEYGYDESALQPLSGSAATNHSSPANTYRGNLTTVRHYADADLTSPSNAVTETRTYDVCGNLVTASTSCCEQTKFTLTSNTQYCWPETTTRGSATDATQQNKTTAVYDLYTGLVNSSRDADHQNTSTTSAFIISYDPLTLRPVTEQSPTGSYAYHLYDDTGLAVYDFVYKAGESGANWAARTDKYLDGAGRVHGEQAWTKDSQGNYVPDSVTTKFDQIGRLWQQTRPYRTAGSEQWTTYAYDKLDRPTSITAPDGSVTQRFYNEASYPSAATQGAPGQTVRVKDPWNRERWARFDSLNRLVEVVEPNENNNAVATNGYLTSYSYDILGRLTQVTQGDQVRKFRYDTLGRMTHQKLAERDATLNDSGVFVATWDQAQKKITAANGAQWSDVFAYDNRSNLIWRTDARGVKTNFIYNNDPLNRLQSVSYDTSGVPTALTNTWPIANDYNNVSYVYETQTDRDKTRLLASNVQYGMGSEQFVYDNEGRLQTRTQTITGKTAAPLVFDYTYDTLNRVTMLKYPAQWNNGTAPRKIVEPAYDIASRLDSLKYDGTTFASGIQYNPASQTTSLTLPLGNGSQVTESYAYEAPTGLLSSQQVVIGATTRVNLGYTYTDAAGKRTGQLTRVTDNYNPNRSRAFGYDSLGRLAQVKGGSDPALNPQWTQSYAYDRYGNRTSVTKSGPQHTNVPLDAALPNTTTSITSFGLSYQDASQQNKTLTNRITTAGYEYDPAGNLMRGQTADGSWQKYTYNAANRMVKVTTDANGYLAEYIYGGNNQRLVEITTAVTTYYAWDGGQVIAEYWPDSSGTSLQWKKSYVYLGGRLLATEATGGSFQLHHPDRLGTRLVTNRANGDVVSEQIGLPFGTEIPGTLPNGTESYATNQSNRRFTSYDRSSLTKLDYAVNRYYNAGLGRFTQVDPIGMGAASLSDPQSLNLYAYCGNDPVNHTDPDGLFFGKLFRAIGKFFKAVAKVLANKWVQLALGIALAILSAGSGAFVIHNLVLKVGQVGIGIAQTTTITAAGWAAIGLTVAQGVGAVSSLTQKKGSAEDDPHAVTMGVVAALENALDAAETALLNPKCRDLIAGLHSKHPRSLLKQLRRKSDGIRLGKLNAKAVTKGTGSNARITFDIYTVGRDPAVGGAVGQGAYQKYADGVTQDQARTVLVLHELAHATGALKYSYGAHRGSFGGKSLPEPKDTDTGAVEANKRIYETCIKGTS